MESIRSFVAIELPAELKERIADYQKNLKRFTRHVRWVQPASLHITLKFLGEQEKPLIERVQQNLKAVQGAFSPFDVTISQFGAFPGKRNPRVFWLGIKSDPLESMFDLFHFLENNLQGLGFKKETRRFSPHLTLARVKAPERYDELFRFVQTNPFAAFSFKVREIVLMQSFLKPQGAVYKPIEKYVL
jgi:2'-5' RNA ligase